MEMMNEQPVVVTMLLTADPDSLRYESCQAASQLLRFAPAFGDSFLRSGCWLTRRKGSFPPVYRGAGVDFRSPWERLYRANQG